MRDFEEIKPSEQEKELYKMFDTCQWIRDNVQKSKLEEVKDFLVYFENYFDVNQPKMIEHIYRGIKNSLKVEYAQVETISFVRWLVYLFSDKKESYLKSDVESDVESDLVQLVGQKSFLVNFFCQSLDKSKIQKKGNYLLFDKVTLTFLGSNIMFYYILKSVVSIIDRVINDPEYKLNKILDWQEAISVYVISEFKHKNDT